MTKCLRMKLDEPFLTICIPTYNRKNYLENQLAFFQKQVENNPNILQKVRFIVSDNASTDDTCKMLESWDKSLCFFDYYRNDKNLGLVGNIIASLKRSTTDYVWFVSDDDQLKEGIIERVLDALINSIPEFLFINYSKVIIQKKLDLQVREVCMLIQEVPLSIFSKNHMDHLYL